MRGERRPPFPCIPRPRPTSALYEILYDEGNTKNTSREKGEGGVKHTG